MKSSLPRHFSYLLEETQKKRKQGLKRVKREYLSKEVKEEEEERQTEDVVTHQVKIERKMSIELNEEKVQQKDLTIEEEFGTDQQPRQNNISFQSNNFGELNHIPNITSPSQVLEASNTEKGEIDDSTLIWKREKHLQTEFIPKLRKSKEGMIPIGADMCLEEKKENPQTSAECNSKQLLDFNYPQQSDSDSFYQNKSTSTLCSQYKMLPLGKFKKCQSVTMTVKGRVECNVWSNLDQKSLKDNKKQYPFQIINTIKQMEEQGSRYLELMKNSSEIISSLKTHTEQSLQQALGQFNFSTEYIFAVYFSIETLRNLPGIATIYYSQPLLSLLGLNPDQFANTLLQQGEIIDLLQFLHPQNRQQDEIEVIERDDQIVSPYLQQFECPKATLFMKDGCSVDVNVSHQINDLAQDYLEMFGNDHLTQGAPKFVLSLYKLSVEESEINKIKIQRKSSILKQKTPKIPLFLKKYYNYQE